MIKPKLYMLIGLPASGKSTYAKTLDGIIFSSDTLREELFEDINCQSDNTKLFTELHRRIKECLKAGNNAIYDATNINYKRRMSFLHELKNIPCEKICVLMATPYEVCITRNNNRERKVPEHVIERMYKQFNAPYWYEGWDDIQIINGYKNSKSVSKWLKNAMKFDQQNHHHSLTLGQHCYGVMQRTLESKMSINEAAPIHDCGKPFTKTFINKKGEVTEEAHYYHHQYVGAYDSFFFDVNDHLYVAQLIQWHMHPYLAWAQSEKAKERDRKLLGDTLFKDILLLHEADVAAH